MRERERQRERERENIKPKRRSEHSLGERGQAASSLRTGSPEHVCSWKGGGAETLGKVRVGAGRPAAPCHLWLKCSVQDAPVFSLCVNTFWSVAVTKVWACPLPNLLLPTLFFFPLSTGSSES